MTTARPSRTCPPHLASAEERADPQPFRLLFLRRLRLPLPLRAPAGDQSAACANAGVLGRRGWVLENVAAHVCREAGGRVRTNLAVRDMDLGAQVQFDGGRLEIVVDGLPLWSGSQLAVDTTMVCPLSHDVAQALSEVLGVSQIR